MRGTRRHGGSTAESRTRYLGEPQEVMHEAAAVRVVDFYNRNLVFSGHQQAVLMVENGRQVHAPAHTS